MAEIDGLWRYDGRRVVVTGCSSGIGAQVVRQLTELGALFNIAGVSSGIGDPLLVATVNFLGTRHFTEALIPRMGPGSSVASVSSLAAAAYRDHQEVISGLLHTQTMRDGIQWCHRHPEALADGGYRLSKEEIILYTMQNTAALDARGIRINCTAPGVTDTPILDQLRTRYGQQYLDDIPKPLGRVSHPSEQAAVLVFLNSGAASYITGQVIWVDGGNVAAAVADELEKGRAPWPA